MKSGSPASKAPKGKIQNSDEATSVTYVQLETRPTRRVEPFVVGQWSQFAVGLPHPPPLPPKSLRIFVRRGHERVSAGFPLDVPHPLESVQLRLS